MFFNYFKLENEIENNFISLINDYCWTFNNFFVHITFKFNFFNKLLENVLPIGGDLLLQVILITILLITI